MAAPNLQAPTTINGKTTYLNLSTTNDTDLLTNASGSGKALRVGTVNVANYSTAGSADITLRVYSAASGGTGYRICSALTVPVGASVIVVGKENPIWLEEDRRISVQASAASYLDVVCSYEDIS